MAPKRLSNTPQTKANSSQSPKSSTTKQQPQTQNRSIQKTKKKKASRIMHVGSKQFKVSAKVLQEIKLYQKITTNLIPRLPFSRLIQALLLECRPTGGRIQWLALEALQAAAEAYLVQYFEDSYICTLHSRRSTLNVRDMKLIEHLRRP